MPRNHAADGSPSRTRSMIVRAGLPAGVLALVAAAVATLSTTNSGSGGGAVDLGRVQPVAFQQFPDCASLLGYYRSHGAGLVTAYGLPGDSPVFAMDGAIREGAPVPAPMAAPGRANPQAGTAAGAAPDARAADGSTSASGTNVQVAGVDEADIAKVDGDLLVTLTGNRLRVARIGAGQVHPLGSLTVGGLQPTEMLVDGHTALVIGTGFRLPRPVAEPDMILPRPLSPRLRLTEVDLTDPAHPRITRAMDVDGTSAGARLVDGVARIAVSTNTHRLRWVLPTQPGNAAVGRALAANRALVGRSSIGDWLPAYRLTQYGTGGRPEVRSGQLLGCSEVAAPVTFSGLSTLSLLSFDLRSRTGIGSWAGAGVVASGTTMYATAEHTYVTTTPWAIGVVPAGQRPRTQVHLFDTSGDGAPRYLASGSVPGTLIGQFAMDEYAGDLRVASTEQSAVVMPDGAPAPSGVVPNSGGPDSSTAAGGTAPNPGMVPRPLGPSQSQVSVLAQHGRQLVTMGSVTGLGRGETIRAVRFIGPVGYVVTFRQTDPLYTLDLSRPDRPRVAGELKLLGYSAYLHPAGDGLLLGLGQAADASGATDGLQMSLFDVSDPAAPRRVAQVQVAGAYSDAEGDHHAFTFADGLALAPYVHYGEPVPIPAPPPAPATGSGSAPSGAGSTGSGTASGSTGSGSASGGTSSDSSGSAVTIGEVPVTRFDTGVLAVRVGGRGLDAPVSLRPIANGPLTMNPTTGQFPNDVVEATPLRTFVVGGFIYTVTPVGIAVHNATTLQRVGFTRF